MPTLKKSRAFPALWRVSLKILLFACLINVNKAAPAPETTSSSSSSPPPQSSLVDGLSIGLSSPAPFSLPRDTQNDKTAFELLGSTGPGTTLSTFSIEDAPIIPDGDDNPKLVNDNNEQEDNKVNEKFPGIEFHGPDIDLSPPSSSSSSPTTIVADSNAGAFVPAQTTPSSIEQQDEPNVPPTTLTFANVASGTGLMEPNGSNKNNNNNYGINGSTSNIGAIGVSGSSNINGGGMTTLYNDDAIPPFAAVDDEYVPSKPLNLTVLDVGSTSITMSWLPPKNQNGAIAGYHVFHIHENQTGVEIVKNVKNAAESTITYVLPNLKPFTDYRVIVKAFTTKNEGEKSDEIKQKTDVAGASSPLIVNLTCHSQDSIALRWRRPYEFYNSIDMYIIKAKIAGQDTHRDISINASDKELETAIILQNLTTNSLYEVKIAAATTSIINPKKIVLGRFSDTRKIMLQPNCEKIQPLLRQSHNDYNLAVLVGIIFSCFGIVLIVMAFFLWRKCFHAAYYYLDDPPHHPNMPQVDWEVPIEVGGEIRAAVPVNEFAKHVASLHADGDIGFSREYEAIQNECIPDDLACEHSQHPENKRKNRYLNITAYDHSRVHLHPTPGQKKNLDYINANYIDGYQKSRAFIGTQGPLPDTFDCFWRMIWEQRVAIIIMITNLVERGRRKCDMYWPKDGTETYGVIQVKLVEEEVMATYTVRTFQIKHLKLKKKKQANIEKIVYQYHYTNWPDHGTPDHPLPVLNFVKKSSAANPPEAGPIVVHCSAGVGRTGTYIVLDAMLKQIQHKGVVNVFGFLRHIRIQRNFLVQTEEQYIFIHDALVEAIASGESNLRAEQIEELKNCTPYLEQQYKNIIQFQTKDIHIASAMKQVNSIKNRGAIFPIESSRVHLTPKPGEEGSDYINASWLHGFRRLRDFIVTQHPMAHTIKDFWQMVWDHNAQTIVLLSSLDEINFAQFWPDDTTPIESDYYRVKFLSKTNKSDYVSRDFVIQSIQDDYELNVKMLHCPSWPEMSNPNSIYDFIVDVHERCNDYRNGPIVVVDRYGGAQACTFCAVSSLAIEMEYCQTANIYQYAKLYHNKRPGVWTSSEDIRLIYNIVSYLPSNLQLLKRTALRTEFEDVTTATPDLYSKICSNGNGNNIIRNPSNNAINAAHTNVVNSTVGNIQCTANTNFNNAMAIDVAGACAAGALIAKQCGDDQLNNSQRSSVNNDNIQQSSQIQTQLHQQQQQQLQQQIHDSINEQSQIMNLSKNESNSMIPSLNQSQSQSQSQLNGHHHSLISHNSNNPMMTQNSIMNSRLSLASNASSMSSSSSATPSSSSSLALSLKASQNPNNTNINTNNTTQDLTPNNTNNILMNNTNINNNNNNNKNINNKHNNSIRNSRTPSPQNPLNSASASHLASHSASHNIPSSSSSSPPAASFVASNVTNNYNNTNNVHFTNITNETAAMLNVAAANAAAAANLSAGGDLLPQTPPTPPTLQQQQTQQLLLKNGEQRHSANSMKSSASSSSSSATSSISSPSTAMLNDHYIQQQQKLQLQQQQPQSEIQYDYIADDCVPAYLPPPPPSFNAPVSMQQHQHQQQQLMADHFPLIPNNHHHHHQQQQHQQHKQSNGERHSYLSSSSSNSAITPPSPLTPLLCSNFVETTGGGNMATTLLTSNSPSTTPLTNNPPPITTNGNGILNNNQQQLQQQQQQLQQQQQRLTAVTDAQSLDIVG